MAYKWDYRLPSKVDWAELGYYLKHERAPHEYIYEVISSVEAPDDEAEMQSGYTNIFDGTGTAAVVDVVSANAADNGTDGTGIRTLEVFGINGSGLYASETITMNGVTAVTTSTSWQRLIGARARSWGSGGKAAGAITCHENGGVINTYWTIPINENYTTSHRIWVPSGYNAKPLDLYGYVTLENSAATGIDTTAGAVYSYSYSGDASNISRADLGNMVIREGMGPTHYRRNHDIIDGGGNAYITLKHAAVADDKNRTVIIKNRYYIWAD